MTNEELVRDYLSGLAPAQIAEKYKMLPASVASRIGHLRKAGVALPYRREDTDVSSLNALVAAAGLPTTLPPAKPRAPKVLAASTGESKPKKAK